MPVPNNNPPTPKPSRNRRPTPEEDGTLSFCQRVITDAINAIETNMARAGSSGVGDEVGVISTESSQDVAVSCTCETASKTAINSEGAPKVECKKSQQSAKHDVCICEMQSSHREIDGSKPISNECLTFISEQIQSVISRTINAINKGDEDVSSDLKDVSCRPSRSIPISGASSSSSSSSAQRAFVTAFVNRIVSENVFGSSNVWKQHEDALRATSSVMRQNVAQSSAPQSTYVVNVHHQLLHHDTSRQSLINIAVNPVEEEPEIEIRITPPPFPPRVAYGPPPIAGAPPSYSAVMKIGPLTETLQAPPYTHREIRIQPSPPFIARSPPPTYAEAEGFFGEDIIAPSIEHLVLGPEPMLVVCPRCGTIVVTSTHTHNSNLTHFAALALCLCGCWPCCLLPYCVNSCKTTYHQCPNCNNYLGMYRPW